MSERWASFDCYGTLIDWEGGMEAALRSVVGDERARAVLDTYYLIEPAVQRERFRPYREILAEALGRAAAEHGIALDDAARDVLGATLTSWPVFADTAPALRELRARGWRLAVLSNVDRVLVEATVPRLGAEIDLVITSEDVKSYKPGLAHFEELARRTAVAPGRWVHVCCSLLHDVAPAAALGVPSVWIDRVDSPADPRPAAILPDLRDLPDALDRLVA